MPFGFGAMAGLGLGLFGGGLALNQAAKQNTLNREVFEYQQHVDSHAVRMRAADMKAAGISKNLAAGNPVSTGVTGAPRVGDPSAAMQNMLNAKLMTAQVGKTQAETQLTRQTARKALSERIYTDTLTELTKERDRYTGLQADAQDITNRFLTDLKQAQNDLTRYQADAAKHKVNYELYAAVKAELETTLTEIGIRGATADAALKELTILIQQHDFEIYRRRGVTTKARGGNIVDTVVDQGEAAINAVKEVLEREGAKAAEWLKNLGSQGPRQGAGGPNNPQRR